MPAIAAATAPSLWAGVDLAGIGLSAEQAAEIAGFRPAERMLLALRLTQVSATARIVAAAVAYRGWIAWPSNADIGALAGVRPSRVSEALGELDAAGVWVRARKRYGRRWRVQFAFAGAAVAAAYLERSGIGRDSTIRNLADPEELAAELRDSGFRNLAASFEIPAPDTHRTGTLEPETKEEGLISHSSLFTSGLEPERSDERVWVERVTALVSLQAKRRPAAERWRSLGAAIDHYNKHPEKFERDLADVIATPPSSLQEDSGDE